MMLKKYVDLRAVRLLTFAGRDEPTEVVRMIEEAPALAGLSLGARGILAFSRLTAWGARHLQSWTYRMRDRVDPKRRRALSSRRPPAVQPVRDLQHRVDVVITTFEARLLHSCIDLIGDVSHCSLVRDLIVVVNGPPGTLEIGVDPRVRQEFRTVVNTFPNVRIVECGKYRGLATMWNLGLALTDTNLKWITNDDIVLAKNFEFELKKMVSSAYNEGLCLGNGFSSFVISDRCLERVGWFDERYVGIGSEDGDYYERYEIEYGHQPPRVRSNVFLNLSSGSDPKTGTSSVSEYAAPNRELLRLARFRRENGTTSVEESMFLRGRYGYWMNRAFGDRGISCSLSAQELEWIDTLDMDAIWTMLDETNEIG